MNEFLAVACFVFVTWMFIVWFASIILIEFNKVHKKMNRILFYLEHVQKDKPKREKLVNDKEAQEDKKGENEKKCGEGNITGGTF